VASHPFFDDIRPPTAREAVRLSLVAVLRGNHGIRSRAAKALLKYDVEPIGMRIGAEVFELLKTVVLVRKEQAYVFTKLLGGPKYLKL
jgi:hypothetical protein